MVRNGGSQARSYGEISWPKGAAHLNGTEGTLVKFIKKESRWSVRTDDNTIVNAKPCTIQFFYDPSWWSGRRSPNYSCTK